MPKRQATQIGQHPFNDTRQCGIFPTSAIVISFGNGRWCNRVWWLIIFSCNGESAFGCKICSNCKGVMCLISRMLSSKDCGIDAISGFSMKFNVPKLMRMTKSLNLCILHCSCISSRKSAPRKVNMSCVPYHCGVNAYLGRKTQDLWVSQEHQEKFAITNVNKSTAIFWNDSFAIIQLSKLFVFRNGPISPVNHVIVVWHQKCCRTL